MNIAVVILNWNGKVLLQQFLPSVVACSKEALVHVVDNASNDGSVDFVHSNFPSVNVIQNADNYGYAKGYNEALKQIDADVYCLLNSDVEVTPNWLTPIINTFQTELNTAIIQPKILDYHNKAYFEYAGAAGGFIDKFGYPYCRGRVFDTLENDVGQYNDNADIFWASGACLFIRSSVYKKLEGFDEAYFAHFEEIDLCWRAYNAGYVTRYVGSSTIYHVGGATLKNNNPNKTYLNFRNSLFTITKNAHGNVFFIVLIRLIMDGFAALKFLFEGKLAHIVSILSAHLSYYRRIPTLLKQRTNSKQNGDYFKIRSVVWSYFIINKKNFKSL